MKFGVSSATVLQHRPEELQRQATKHAAEALKTGGYMVLLENAGDFGVRVVFPHRPKE